MRTMLLFHQHFAYFTFLIYLTVLVSSWICWC